MNIGVGGTKEGKNNRPQVIFSCHKWKEMQSLFFLRMKATLGLAGMGTIGAEKKGKEP